VISIFAIVILSVLGLVFRSNHHEFVGGDEDPSDGPEVAGTIFTAVTIYAVRFVSYSFLEMVRRMD
jgi:ribonuclease kappa